jgi:riboflavin kinase/FMN adenylyltransferase
MKIFDTFSGSVIHGTKTGRTIGFPTLNIAVNQGNISEYGVYVVSVKINKEQHIGIMSIGCRPTFSNENNKTIEIHLLNTNKNYYDATVEVFPIVFIRPNKKFNSINELKFQLEKDKNFAENYINYRTNNTKK